MSKEKFSWDKFKKIFTLGSSVEWVKSIAEIVDLRKLLIYGILGGLIWYFGFKKGIEKQPLRAEFKYDEDVRFKIDEQTLLGKEKYIRISKDGGLIYKGVEGGKEKLLDGELIEGGLDVLRRKYSPIAWERDFILVGGYGIEIDDYKNDDWEIGAGMSLFRYWKGKGDVFATNKGVYLGTSYSVTDNSGFGVGVGKGYEKRETRALIYFRTKFTL